MPRWLCVREDWQDVLVGRSAKSGGVLAGFVITRTALQWVEAPSKWHAMEHAPFGTTAVLSFLSLDVDDRDGWLKMTLGVPTVVRRSLFGEATIYTQAVAQAMPNAVQLEMRAA